MSVVSSIIRGKSLEKTRWKNGRGVTREIARFPSGSSDYDWRLSFADIDQDSPFSEFPGYDRLLVVWSGPGIVLGGVPVRTLEPYRFSGDAAQEANLIDGKPVRDLGLIFKRGFEARFEIQRAGSTTANFLFIAEGSLTVDGQQASESDTVVEPRQIEGDGVGIAVYLRGMV